MTLRLIYLLTCTWISTGILAQQSIDTKSGQKLMVSADGSYTTLSTINEGSDTFMGEALDAFENPDDPSANLEKEELSILNELKNQLKNIEAKATVRRYNLKQEIAQLKDKISKSKKAQLAKSEIKKIEEIKKKSEMLYDMADKQAEDSYEHIKKVRDLKKYKKSDRKEKINSLVDACNEQYGIDIKSVHIKKATDYTFSVDDKDPDSKRHKGQCDISFNGKDKDLDKNRIDHAPQHLFSHTNPKAKHFFKESNFLNCNAQLSKIGGKYYLNLNMVLASKDAKRTYGVINKDDMVKLTFVNRENCILRSLYQVEPQLEQYSGNSIYRAIYPLSKDHVKIIKKEDLDKITLIWSTGSESYDIYEIDLLANQYRCIEDAK